MTTPPGEAGQAHPATIEQNKQIVRRGLIADVMDAGNLDVIDQLYDPRLAPAARRWIEPFLAPFSDLDMRIDQLIAENDTSSAGSPAGPLGDGRAGR